MDAIEKLFELDIVSIVMGIFIIMSAIIAMVTIITKFMDFIGKPIKWFKDRDKDSQLLICTSEGLSALQKQRDEDVRQSMKHDQAIRDELKNLTDMFIESQINSMRWSILDFTIDISSGKKVTRESYDYILKLYENYEDILEKNGMENGLIDESIKFIKEKYHEELMSGF